MVRIITVAVLAVCFLAAFPEDDTVVAEPSHEGLSHEDINDVKNAISVHQRELARLADYINDLEYAADESSNSGRSSAINDILDSMVRVILEVEEKVGKTHKIQQHGTEPGEYQADQNTYSYQKKRFQKAQKTGGEVTGKYWIHRLAQMQSHYRMCSRSKEMAINKSEKSLPGFIDSSKKFALLMERNIVDARKLLPEDDSDSWLNDGASGMWWD